MKKKIPPFLSGMLTMGLIVSLGVSALAIGGQMTITVDPINIQVNGQTFAPKDATGAQVPVFAYNGTTYAPLRALAEAYGLEVGYDQAANMATVRDGASYGGEVVTTEVPKLSSMSYEEFKSSLTLVQEVGTKLTEPTQKGQFYHYHLSFGDDLDGASFLAEWEIFRQTETCDAYLNKLLDEYLISTPYNAVNLHIEYNGKLIKTVHGSLN